METNNSENKKSWGGSRKGAGRKKTSAALVNFRVDADIYPYLQEQANKSRFINSVLREYFKLPSQEE